MILARIAIFLFWSGTALALIKNEMHIQTFTNGREVPVPYNRVANHGKPPVNNRTSPIQNNAPRTGATRENGSHGSISKITSSNGTYSNGASSNGTSRNGSVPMRMMFQNPYAACNFIVTWDGENVGEVLDAIRYARECGDRFIQDKLIEYILNIPLRHPRPLDIPAFVEKPVWAVDKHGRALIGMPGAETIVEVERLRQKIHHA